MILNKDVEKNLSLDEIEKFFSSLGRVKNIVLGGGEPFLRQDLVQLCIALEKTSHPRAFTIPTNGLASDIIFEKVKGILENTQTRLVIPISIDGPSSIHEEIRGVPGLFEKTQQTYKNLLLLYYMFYPRITLQVNATISSHNYKYFEETYQIVRKYFSKARFTFEVIRGHYDSSVAGGITDEMYNDLISLVQGLNDPALKNLIQLHKLALKTIKKKKQIVTCNAGNNFIVLDHLGNLAPCEILPPFANIRDIKYDFLSIKNDARWQKVIQDIRNGKCHCTHMCFLGSSQHDNGNKIKNFFKK